VCRIGVTGANRCAGFVTSAPRSNLFSPSSWPSRLDRSTTPFPGQVTGLRAPLLVVEERRGTTALRRAPVDGGSRRKRCASANAHGCFCDVSWLAWSNGLSEARCMGARHCADMIAYSRPFVNRFTPARVREKASRKSRLFSLPRLHPLDAGASTCGAAGASWSPWQEPARLAASLLRQYALYGILCAPNSRGGPASLAIPKHLCHDPRPVRRGRGW